MALIDQIKKIRQLVADNRRETLGLFDIEGEKLKTPLADDTLSVLTYRSPRGDELVEWLAVTELVAAIKATKKFKGLNHIGLCYKVISKQNEIKRIIDAARKKRLHVYQEASIDEADWLFVGDISEITNPLLEFVLVDGEPSDKWVDYWLPHIQFDIDTGLSPGEIKTIVQKHIHQPATPHPIQIDGITYIQRVNLGCLEGVNLFLDISTHHRDINYRKAWKKLA